MKYRAFLSYSHADRKWAKWLHRALESYRPPKHLADAVDYDLPRRLAPIFRDRDELPSSANLSDAVNEALAQSTALIVVCSPAAASSKWVAEEIRAFQRLGRAEYIFCFIVDGDPNAADENNCFPDALTEDRREPVAADARAGGDGRRNAMLKVAAGLLGVGFDELKQRDLRRHQRRLAGITVASLVIAAVTIALAIEATIARDEARLRTQQAEDLIGFMLGDLRDQLHEIQRLDIFQSVGDKAMDYFALLDEEDESDHSLSQRAMAMRHIGEVRQDQGDLPAAYESFNESVRIMEELARRRPDDGETSIELANSYFYVGYVYWEQGNLAGAREQFERVLPIVTGLRDREPTNTTWLVETGYAYTNLGRVQELLGSLQQALASYEQVMLANRKLTELEPDNPDWQLELGFAHNNLGKLVASLGRLKESAQHYQADVDIKTQLVRDNPDHELWESYKADSEFFLGWVLAHSGRVADGTDLLRSALDTYLRLTDLSPDHALFLDRRARVERHLASVLGSQKQADQARRLAESSVQISSGLIDGDASNSRWRRGLVEAMLIASEIESSSGNEARGLEHLNAAGPHLRFLIDQDPANLETQRLAVHDSVLRAKLKTPHSASDALKRLDEFFSGSSDPWVLSLQLTALQLLDHQEHAVTVGQQLHATGYRSPSQ